MTPHRENNRLACEQVIGVIKLDMPIDDYLREARGPSWIEEISPTVTFPAPKSADPDSQ